MRMISLCIETDVYSGKKLKTQLVNQMHIDTHIVSLKSSTTVDIKNDNTSVTDHSWIQTVNCFSVVAMIPDILL